jgi:Mg-chelatase subunit ChlD
LPEDVLGALDQVAEKMDWKSKIKFAVLICDAPGHTRELHDLPHDRYMASHPRGLTTQAVMGKLRDKDIDLILCHIGKSTEKMEKVFRRFYDEGDRKRTMTSVQLGEASAESSPSTSAGPTSNHFVFCLDESGSMSLGQRWQDVMQAYRGHLARRRIDQGVTDKVSVITFASSPRLAVDQAELPSAPADVPYHGGGTEFSPALQMALQQLQKTASAYKSVLIFMSDGEDQGSYGDPSRVCRQLHSSIPGVQAHFIGFGGDSEFILLESMAKSMGACGHYAHCADGRSIQAKFADIARGCQVTEKLMQAVGKRISDEMCTKLQLEYL